MIMVGITISPENVGINGRSRAKPTRRTITIPNTDVTLRTNINDLTEDTNPDAAADYIETYDTDSAGSKKVLLGRLHSGVLGTPKATTSGTSSEYTGIPSWVTEVVIMFKSVSTNGTNNLDIQIGPSGGVETTGYASTSVNPIIAGATSGAAGTTAFAIDNPSAGSGFSGFVELHLFDSNTTWTCSGVIKYASNACSVIGGHKSITGDLSRIKLSANGDTFDAGEWNIRYR